MKELVCEFCDSIDLIIVNDYLYLCQECGEYGDLEEAGFTDFEKFQRKPRRTKDEDEEV